MSRLILGVLASVAEFERDIIRERTRLGLEKAKANGKRLGRPMVLSDATAARVKKLRAEGKSWAHVAAKVRCKVGAARLAAAR
jgi:putative DNA-invertase from lambdoid prophage Rac